MVKKVLLIVFSIMLTTSTAAMSEEVFANLNGLTVEQKQQMSAVYKDYKTKNNELLLKILSYTNKIANLKLTNSDKSPEEISLISDSFERNIAVLKKQQQMLANETEAIYKLILTDNQYRQYQVLQLKAQDAFAGFLQK